MQFRPAKRSHRKLRLALTGPAGSGKSLTALKIARGLVGPDGRIGVIDTEQGSADLYADHPDVGAFGVLPLHSYAPADYVEAMQAAHTAKCDVVIIDSVSQEWAGPGGVLQIVDERTATNGGNKYTAWGKGTSEHNSFVNGMLLCPYHLIVTIRSKMSYELVSEPGKKAKVQKIGMAPVQRDGLEYEFDIVGDIDTEHVLTISKERTQGVLSVGDRFERPDPPLGETIRRWLDHETPPPFTKTEVDTATKQVASA